MWLSVLAGNEYLRWQQRAEGGDKQLEVVMRLTCSPVSSSTVYHCWSCLLK